MIEETLHFDIDVSPRRKARIVALQVLYEVEAVGHSEEESFQWILEEKALSPEVETFAHSLVQGVLANKALLDRHIQGLAPARPVNQLAMIDRTILRMALYEILIDKSTPPKATINEAVELAKLFGSESSSRFVNGVLGSVMERLQNPPKPSSTLSHSKR